MGSEWTPHFAALVPLVLHVVRSLRGTVLAVLTLLRGLGLELLLQAPDVGLGQLRGDIRNEAVSGRLAYVLLCVFVCRGMRGYSLPEEGC